MIEQIIKPLSKLTQWMSRYTVYYCPGIIHRAGHIRAFAAMLFTLGMLPVVLPKVYEPQMALNLHPEANNQLDNKST